MPGERRDRLTLDISETSYRGRGGVRIVGWGVHAGRYGSLWSRFVPTELRLDGLDEQEMARLLLTALYGLDYDL